MPPSTADASPGSPGAARESDILDGIPYPCFALDREGRFTRLNRQAEQFFEHLLGRPPGELLGRNIRDECPEVADSTFAREGEQALAEHRRLEAKTFYPTLGRWFTVHVTPLADGLCVLLQDTHERTELERALRQRAEELAESAAGKDEFLVQLAHEVRNALAPIRNALHLTAGAGLEGQDAQVCALAEREVRRLSRLMDDLLKVSSLLPGSVRPSKERVNLTTVVARAATAALSSPEMAGRSLTVHLPPEPLWLEADPAQVEQVLTHLLDNAAKFTRAGGHIRVSAERDGAAAVLTVQDNGVGLSPELLPRVFNLFMRGDRGPARFQGGVGVGLLLVRRLVELHGGSVEARSAGPGRGSEFVVRLPGLEGPEPAAESRPAEAEDEEGRPLRVLVVDDCMDTAQSLALMLGRWGCEVRVVYDGPRALAEAEVRRPDVVMLDIGMPGMNGYEVAERLRQVEGGEDLVLVAVTGYGQDEDRARAREAGFDYHMVKPVDPADLKELLAAWQTLRKTAADSPT